MPYDTIIVGAGPAGITAAIQLTRMGNKILLMEKADAGGLIRNAWRVENYLGLNENFKGCELARRFSLELERFKVGILHEEVMSVKQEDSFYLVRTPRGVYDARTVIVATGTTPLRAGIDGEDALAGSLLFYNVGDIQFTKEKNRIAIIGGGDCAFDGALSLYDLGHSPFLLLRNRQHCLPLLWREVEQRKIQVLSDITVQHFTRKGHVIHIHCDAKSYDADFVLVAIGRTPSTPLLPHETCSGLFLAGDVQGGFCRQVHIATGDGMKAAMKAHHYLENS